jgi:hypothetical protein
MMGVRGTSITGDAETRIALFQAKDRGALTKRKSCPADIEGTAFVSR